MPGMPPMPGMMPGMGRPQNTGPKKKPVKAKATMKPLFWAKVKNTNYKNTIWGELEPQEEKFLQLIQGDEKVEDGFVAKFGKAQKKKKKKEGGGQKEGGASAGKKEKKKSAGILDGDRVRNVGLGIGRVKTSNEDVVKAIMKMDDTIVSPSLINLMLTGKLFPADEEREELVSWDESQGSLNKVEKFFLALCDIPKLELRLKCMDTLHTFSNQFTEVENDVNTLLAATKAVQESGKFKEWLTLVLATGNYMNGKTKRGCAFGFELGALDKLADTKSVSKPTVSLLQWLVDFVTDTMQRKDMLELEKEWHILEQVKTVILEEVEKNLGLLAAKLSLCEAQAGIDRPAGDKFNDVVKPFVIKSKKLLSTLETKASAAKRKFTDLYVGFGEDPKKMDGTAIRLFWDRLKNFADNIVKAAHQNEELNEKLRKLEEAEQKKAARAAKKAKGKDDGASKAEGSVFDQFAKARSGNADDIVANIRAGRKGMRRKKR
eukprot:INCI15254.1.p1 GENE.INCI15254.1~~INCI15254.1.p1  ORF type:complete len:538 (-),score=116.41 INCI15254.1:58-1524(-)